MALMNVPRYRNDESKDDDDDGIEERGPAYTTELPTLHNHKLQSPMLLFHVAFRIRMSSAIQQFLSLLHQSCAGQEFCKSFTTPQNSCRFAQIICDASTAPNGTLRHSTIQSQLRLQVRDSTNQSQSSRFRKTANQSKFRWHHATPYVNEMRNTKAISKYASIGHVCF
jgi:hypothetical protein